MWRVHHAPVSSLSLHSLTLIVSPRVSLSPRLQPSNMAGIRLAPEDSDVSHARALTTADLISDDDRSVAADSWSIKSDYGSTLDDEQRHADAAEALSAVPHRAASDYRSIAVCTMPFLDTSFPLFAVFFFFLVGCKK